MNLIKFFLFSLSIIQLVMASNAMAAFTCATSMKTCPANTSLNIETTLAAAGVIANAEACFSNVESLRKNCAYVSPVIAFYSNAGHIERIRAITSEVSAPVPAKPILNFSAASYNWTQNVSITSQTPTNTGGAIDSCGVSPLLPSGLYLDPTTCAISGRPTVSKAVTNYTVSAQNSGGSSIKILAIAVIANPNCPLYYQDAPMLMVSNGGTAKAFSSDSGTCTSQTRLCSSGKLSGTYTFKLCTPGNPR